MQSLSQRLPDSESDRIRMRGEIDRINFALETIKGN